MSYEITESRTPPTVTLSVTPTSEREFNYPQNPPLVLSAERFKDVSNLKVNQRRSRSFTPVKSALYLRSPELSPIGITGDRQPTPEANTTSKESSGDLLTPAQFKLPQPMMKSGKSTTPTGPPLVHHHHHRHHHHHQQKQQQQENPFGTPIVKHLDPNQSHSLDKSASHGYLNHKLDVRLVLKNAGMEQYIKLFDKEKVDFEKFLALCEDDLLRLGVKKKGDRQTLSRIISDLNAS